jgi:hypothetical protein
MKALL